MTQKKIIAKIENQELVKKRHAQIVEAASGLFSKSGFHKTTMREIAEKAKIDLSYLYKYISSKDDILYLFYEHIRSQYEHVYQIIYSSEEDPILLMKDTLSSLFITIHDLTHEVLTMYTESRHLERDSLHSVLESESKMVNAFEKIIKRGMESGSFKVRDSFMAANILQYLVVIECLRGWNIRDRLAFTEFKESVIDFIMGGLRVDEDKWRSIKISNRGESDK